MDLRNENFPNDFEENFFILIPLIKKMLKNNPIERPNLNVNWIFKGNKIRD